jgi:hypothetical protein
MEEGMKKLLGASFLLFIMVSINSNAFGASLNCYFKNPEATVEGITKLEINDDVLVVNETEAIELQHSRIKCGQFGKQHRFDGLGNGLQIILKSCTDEAVLEGHLINANESQVAAVLCDEVKP